MKEFLIGLGMFILLWLSMPFIIILCSKIGDLYVKYLEIVIDKMSRKRD